MSVDDLQVKGFVLHFYGNKSWPIINNKGRALIVIIIYRQRDASETYSFLFFIQKRYFFREQHFLYHPNRQNIPNVRTFLLNRKINHFYNACKFFSISERNLVQSCMFVRNEETKNLQFFVFFKS